MRNFVIVAFTSLTGCAAFSPDQVARPTNITLADALTNVVGAFAEAQEKGKEKHVTLGIAVCSVTVTFNVTASATQQGKLVLDATIKAPTPIAASGGLTGERDVGSSATRGNTVTMVLTSELCLPPNTSGANLFANIDKTTQASSSAKGAGKKAGTQNGSSEVSVTTVNPTPIFGGDNGKYTLIRRQGDILR